MTTKTDDLRLFSGRSNYQLAQIITEYLKIPIGEISIRNFADGELWVKYEDNIRGKDVFILQSTNSPAENTIELILMLDAAVRASAKRVTAVIPYFDTRGRTEKILPVFLSLPESWWIYLHPRERIVSSVWIYIPPKFRVLHQFHLTIYIVGSFY